MGLTAKTENTFVCDREGCDTEIKYNPQPLPTEKLPEALVKVVSVTIAAIGHSTFYCDAECAILALREGTHLPKQKPSILPAGEQDIKTVAARASAAKKFRVQ